jgi:acyl carrier protein
MLVTLDDVARVVGLVLGKRVVNGDHRLIEDLGAESADVLNIMVTLEQKYGVRIDDGAMSEASTVSDLYNLLLNITDVGANAARAT